VPVSRGGKVPTARRRQPVSIPTHLTGAMRVAARLILEEGCRTASAVTPSPNRREARRRRDGLEMFPDASLLSNTVSCVKTPKSIDPAAVVTRMRDQYGILIAPASTRCARAPTHRHDAMTASPHYVLPTLSALELALRDSGTNASPAPASPRPGSLRRRRIVGVSRRAGVRSIASVVERRVGAGSRLYQATSA